jgi:hypothetical protein
MISEMMYFNSELPQVHPGVGHFVNSPLQL